MARTALKFLESPAEVQVTLEPEILFFKGPKGELKLKLHPDVLVKQEGKKFWFVPKVEDRNLVAQCGTLRSLAKGVIFGVTVGYECKLELVGVGFRAQLQEDKLVLTLGFSHPVEYLPPKGIRVQVPVQTQIIISGMDHCKIRQVAAEIKRFRSPDAYKGKGLRIIGDPLPVLKVAKKK